MVMCVCVVDWYNNSLYYQYCRARLQGSNDTLDIPNLLSLVKGWMECDGTFLSTYHGRIRLGVDPVCPVEIEKFSEPECQGSREGPL